VNIYVETNFVLELVFQQEQSQHCEQILQVCEAGQAHLIVPAYSLAEPHEKLRRQKNHRRTLQQSLEPELSQLARTPSYAAHVKSIQDTARILFIQSNEEEQQRFVAFRSRLLNTAYSIPLTGEILHEAATHEKRYVLGPQDALVYASVIAHLHQTQPAQACFLNRNFKDFDNPDIVQELAQYQCRMIARFDQGFSFIQAQIQA
jgi:predicted nucleic acid-binding protein